MKICPIRAIFYSAIGYPKVYFALLCAYSESCPWLCVYAVLCFEFFTDEEWPGLIYALWKKLALDVIIRKRVSTQKLEKGKYVLLTESHL